MKLKKKWFVIVPLIIALSLFLGLFYYFNKEDENSLTSSDKKWLKENNDIIVDFELISNYPIFGENNGVFYEFISSLEKDTGIEFNIIPYLKDSKSTTKSYRFKSLSSGENTTDMDLTLQEDVYIIVSKEKVEIKAISDFKDMTLGVLSVDAGEVSYYLKAGSDISYKPYDDIDKMFEDLDKGTVNMVVLPNMMYLDKTIGNDYHINYVLAELNRKIVLTLDDDNKRLNQIITKYYEAWKNKSYVSVYNEKLLDYYLSSNEINDKTKTEFLTKTYTYGYVSNIPYEVTNKSNLSGIAGEYINRMERLANTDFLTFKEYKTIDELRDAIDNGDIDVYFNYYDYETKEYKKTASSFVEEYVVLGRTKDSYIINSFESLKGHKVLLLNNNSLYNYFKDNSKANLEGFATINEMLDKSDKSLIVVDKEVYTYYKNTKFSRYEILYNDYATSEYSFMVKDDATNDTFYSLFNYIISTNSYYRYRNLGLNSLDISLLDNTSFEELYIILLVLIMVPLVFFFVFYVLLKRSKQIKKVRKEERRKYTDMLTSLKNRNYLNLNMQAWNDSKVYPQAVIVLDLNNVKYVNDNYGHEAGDRLIVGAASILVNTQLENSELIRTDGNEFLLYLVGYSEQQVSTYVKKLSKEFKELSYGFGAAIGYSMITDEIKTIDDAINEATLEMRKDKEENR